MLHSVVAKKAVKLNKKYVIHFFVIGLLGGCIMAPSTKPVDTTSEPSPPPTTPVVDTLKQEERVPNLSLPNPKISLVNTLLGHTSSVRSLAISPDNTTIVSGSYDNTIKVWDLATGQLKATLTGHSSEIESVAISTDNSTIVSASGDKTVKVWDLKTGELKATLTNHKDWIWSVAVSSDNTAIVSGTTDNIINLWKVSP